MEATELDLGDDGVEIDGVVIYFVSISGGAALAEPNLEARIDGEKEFRVELFVCDLSSSEEGSVDFDHRLEGAEALRSNAEFSKKNVVGDCEHVELHGHVREGHRCVDFLLVRCLDFVYRHSFTLCQNQVQG